MNRCQPYGEEQREKKQEAQHRQQQQDDDSKSQESGFSREVLEVRRPQSLAENAGEVSVSLEHPSTVGALDPLPLEDKVMLRTSFQKPL